MASRIKLKSSTTPNSVPQISDLSDREVAININDRSLFINDNGSIKEVLNADPNDETIVPSMLSSAITDGVGNTWFVSENGTDKATLGSVNPRHGATTGANSWGKTPSTAFASLRYALDNYAQAGDTIVIEGGSYTETFPLTVPVDVSIKGRGIKSVFIQPTVATQELDCFLLLGNANIEDLTIRNFFYNDSNDTGYGFRLASNFTLTERRPYVQRVSVLTKGSVTSASDPRGYDEGDAGRGALVDGSVANSSTVEASILFNECTFVVPNSVGLYLKNGARCEWLNSFTYYALDGIIGESPDGGTGLGGVARTRLNLQGESGDFTAGSGNQVGLIEAGASQVTGAYTTSGADDNLTMTLTSSSHGLSQGDLVYINTTSGGQTGLTQFRKIISATTNSFVIDGIFAGLASAGNVNYLKTSGYGTIDENDGTYIYLDGKGEGRVIATDETTGKNVSAVDNAVTSTTQVKLGTTSASFDGTDDRLTVPADADFNFSTGEFTLEAFIYLNNTAGSKTIFDFRSNSPTEIAPVVDIDGSDIRYYVNGAAEITGASALNATTWHHVALSRTAGVTKLFVDGAQVGSSYTDGNDFPTRGLSIGAAFDGSAGINGFIDEVRVSKGTSRYNTGFTPTTVQFLADEFTSLLLHMEGANGASVFADDSIVAQDVRTTAGGTATFVTLADYTKFGAELRSISSANVYGERGATADGQGVSLRLISHNFGYIGVGKDDNNDVSLVVQSNEVVEQNNGRVFFTSIDQSGDFRVGDLFLVDQEKGTLSFAGGGAGAGAGAGTSFDQLLVSAGSDTTTILPTSIEVGAFTFFGNTISTTSGNINLTPFTGGEINFNERVNLETFVSGSNRLSLAFDGDQDTGIRKAVDLGDGFFDLVSNGGSVVRVAPGEFRALTDINISSSIPDTVSIGQGGSGYTVGTFTDLPVTGGTGTGLRVDVTVLAFAGTVTQSGSGYVPGVYQNQAFTNIQGQNQQTGTGTGGTGTITVKGIDGGAITGGSGYADQAFADVPLQGGTGSGALATIVVTGGSVSDVSITNNGDNSYTAGDSLTINTADLTYVDEEGNPQTSGGAGFAYTVPNDLYTVTTVVPDNVWNGVNYDVADTITSTIPGGGSGFEFEFTAIQFLSSANIVNENSETEDPVTGEGYVVGEQLSPGFELRSDDTLAGIGTTVTYSVQVRPKSGGGGNAYWIDLGSGYVEAPALDLEKNTLYKFVFAPNATYPETYAQHPFEFSETLDGTQAGGSQYTTLAGALNGDNGAYIIVTPTTPSLYYYCAQHTGMGNSIVSTDTEFGQNGIIAIGSATLENFVSITKQGAIGAESLILEDFLTVNGNVSATTGTVNLGSTTAQNLTVTGTLSTTGGISTSGNLSIQGDLGTSGRLTVAGSNDPTTINGSVAFDTDLLQIDSTNNKISVFGPTDPNTIEDYTVEINSTAKIYNHTFLATDAGSIVSIGNDPESANIATTFDEKFNVTGDSKFDGRILVADGIETAPSITFDSDEKLGFFKNAENEITTVGYNGPIMKQTTQQISFFKPVDLINKAIDTFTVTPGRGYTVGTTNNVLFTGGTGADFTANVTVAFTGDINEPGSGYYNETYENVPVQYVSVASGAITVFGTLTPGSGYVDGTYTDIPLTGGTGTLATGNFAVTNGAVTSVVVNARGSGYTVSDNLGVDTADIGGSQLSGSLTISQAGSGYDDGTYTDVALVNATGSGIGATADITVTSGAISAATVNAGGGGYTASDTFTVDNADLFSNNTYSFTVTNNGASNYVISGTDRSTTHTNVNNANLTVFLGDTLSFNVNNTGHPFYLVSQLDPITNGYNAAYEIPATNNGAEVGTVTYDTSLAVPGQIYYVCGNHAAMVGTISISSVSYGSGGSLAAATVSTGSGFAIRVNGIGASGTGSNAQARIVVEGGVVTEFNITQPGSGYLVNDVLTVNHTDLQYTDPGTGQLVTPPAPSVVVEYTVKRLNSVSYVDVTDLGAGYSVDDVLDLPASFYDATSLGLTLFPTDAAVNLGQEFYAGEYAYEVTSGGTTSDVIPSFGQDGVSSINTNSGGSGYPSNATLERVVCEAVTGLGTGLLVDITTNSSGVVTNIAPSGNLSGDLFQIGDQFTLDNDFINTGAQTISIASGGDNGSYGELQTFDLNQTSTSGTGADIQVRFSSDSSGNIVSATILQNGIGYELGELVEFDGSLFGGGGGGGEEEEGGDPVDDPITVVISVDALTNGAGAAFTVAGVASSVTNGTATIAHNGYFPAGFSLTVNTLAEFNNIQFDAVDGVVTAKKLVASPDGVEIATTMQLNNNTISTTSGNLTLTAEANSQVVIGGSGALALPVGDDSNRPGGPAQGSVRYNTDRNQFEGYNGAYFVSLGGVRDVDGNTFVIGEEFPGADDNNIWFYNDGTQTLRISQTELNLDTLNTVNSNTYGTAKEWSSETAVTQYIVDDEGTNIQQYVYFGDNVYSVDNDGTYGTVAPTHTSGNAINGDVYLTWLDYRYDDLNVNVDNVNVNVNGKFTISTNELEISSSATDEIIKTDKDVLSFGFEPASSDSYQLLKLTNSGALQINRGFSSTSDNYLTILDANLQKLELANTKIFTQTSTLDASTGNIVSATMFPWTEAWSGKFMVEIEEQFPIPDAYPRKQYSELSYLVRGNGQDILYTESNKLYTDVVLADVEADLTGPDIQIRVTEVGSSQNTFVPVASERSGDIISSTFFTQNISSVIDTDADRVVIYANDAANRAVGGFKVGNVSHNGIIFGTQIPLTAGGDVDSASMVFDPATNRIVWAAESGEYIVGDVDPNNSNITFGSLASFTSDTVAAYDPSSTRSKRTCRVLLANSKIVVVYEKDTGGVYGVMGTVTGGNTNSIAWSSPFEFISGLGLQDAFTDGTYVYINYSTGVVGKWEVDTTFNNTNTVASIGGGTNVQWQVVGTNRVMKMYHNTATSEIQARYYDLNDLSEVGFVVSTGVDSEIFSVASNNTDGQFLFNAAFDYSSANYGEQNIQGVITANGDDLDYTSRSRTYAAVDQPVDDDGTLTNTGDLDVIFIGTRTDGNGDLHDIFITSASTTSNLSADADETVSFASAIENRTTYNIKIVSHTVKR